MPPASKKCSCGKTITSWVTKGEGVWVSCSTCGDRVWMDYSMSATARRLEEKKQQELARVAGDKAKARKKTAEDKAKARKKTADRKKAERLRVSQRARQISKWDSKQLLKERKAAQTVRNRAERSASKARSERESLATEVVRLEKALAAQRKRFARILERIGTQARTHEIRLAEAERSKAERDLQKEIASLQRKIDSLRAVANDGRQPNYLRLEARRELNLLITHLDPVRRRLDRLHVRPRVPSVDPATLAVRVGMPSSLVNLLHERDIELREIANGTSALRALGQKLERSKQKVEDAEAVLAAAEADLALIDVHGQRGSQATGRAPSRVVLQWDDAEQLALEYLEWLGFTGVRRTGQGADGGVDVEGRNVVAQVKMHNRPTGRPEVQQLFGVAAAEGKTPAFFAMAFSTEAKAWAERTGVLLFQFQRSGRVHPVSSAARGAGS